MNTEMNALLSGLLNKLSEAKVKVAGVGDVQILKTRPFKSYVGAAIARIVSVDGVEMEVSTIPYRLDVSGKPEFYQTVIYTKDRKTELVDTAEDGEDVDEANMASFKHLAKALAKYRAGKKSTDID